MLVDRSVGDDLNEELSPTTHTHTLVHAPVGCVTGRDCLLMYLSASTHQLTYISWSTKAGTQRRDIFCPPPLKLFLTKVGSEKKKGRDAGIILTHQVHFHINVNIYKRGQDVPSLIKIIKRQKKKKPKGTE